MFTRVIVYCILLAMTPITFAGVSLDKHTIVYQGEINAINNQRVYDLYQTANEKPTTLAITSGGGNIDLGMDLGEFILTHHLDVRIEQFCFSSCANYVFTAGHTKWLGENAILGWHGDAASAYWRDSDIDAMVTHLNGMERQAKWRELREHYDQVIETSTQREIAFFKRIEVDHALLTIGLSKDIAKAAKRYQARGWTVTPALLTKMGVKNLNPITKPWYPKENPTFPLLILQ